MQKQQILPIRVKKLDFFYDNVRILDQISFQIEGGKVYSIVGPNGSGKTTILKNISKALEPSIGSVYIAEEDITTMKAKELAKKVSVVPQNTAIEFPFSVQDIVLMGRAPYLRRFQSESEKDIAIVQEVMEMTDTWHLRDKKINEISGGERQRVVVARALAQQTEIVLLDEPISHLDIHHQVELMETIKRLNQEQNLTIVAVLHDLNLAMEYSDSVILMDQGRVVAVGAPEEVLTETHIRQVYHMEVCMLQNPVSKKPHIIPIGGNIRSNDR